MDDSGIVALGPLKAPTPIPCDAHCALLPGIWRYTVLPGLEELDLAARLEQIPGVRVELWPYVDAYDLDVRLGDASWRVDVKDHAFANGLARHLVARPTLETTWIVVPDARRDQVALLRRGVPSDAGYRFASSSDFVRRVTGAA